MTALLRRPTAPRIGKTVHSQISNLLLLGETTTCKRAVNKDNSYTIPLVSQIKNLTERLTRTSILDD